MAESVSLNNLDSLDLLFDENSQKQQTTFVRPADEVDHSRQQQQKCTILQAIHQQPKVDSPIIMDTSTAETKTTNLLAQHIECVSVASCTTSAASRVVQMNYSVDEQIEVVEKDEIRKREDDLLDNCEEYADDILRNLREAELRTRPKPQYIHQLDDVTSSMRSRLVDWLVQVCEEVDLNMETLYLAVNYADRFLSETSVLDDNLQLLGTASLYIASKYEELDPPSVRTFVYVTYGKYSNQQIWRMERRVLKVLNFRMTTPTANFFLMYFLRALKVDKKIEHLARYLAELTLFEAEPFLEYLPSQIAASAVYLALNSTTGQIWTTELSEQIGYKSHEIRLCIRDMHNSWRESVDYPQKTIQNKYKQEKYDKVSTIPAPAEV
jgi:cyclin A